MHYKINIVFLILFLPLFAFSQSGRNLKWNELPAFKEEKGMQGMFMGVSNDMLLLAGADKIYSYNKENGKWTTAAQKLPKSLAFGASVSYGDKMLLIGGKTASEISSTIYSLEYVNGQINIDTFSSLPYPLANASAQVAGGLLYIAAGSLSNAAASNTFLVLDLGSRKWIKAQQIPGVSRKNPTLSIINKNVYVFGGLDSVNAMLGDSWRFTQTGVGDSLTGEWMALASSPFKITGPNAAPDMGLDHIIFFSEDNTSDSTVAYHIQTNSWTRLKDLNAVPKIKWYNGARWDNDWIVGGYNPETSFYQLFSLSKEYNFGWINWVTLIVYLLFMVWIGYKYDTKDQTTENFFKAGGNIPWWAAGLSIYGAQISAITFMAVPAIVYATDWTLALGSVLILPIVPIVAKYYIPFFRRLNVTSAYEYLEHRFNKNVRLMGSLSFILFQFGRMGVVLYLPAAAIASVTGINIFLLITIMGIICIIYTVMGGMEAVIWTDVAQVIILLGGALLCLIVAIINIDGGLSTIWNVGMADDKFRLVSFGWEYDRLNFWVCVVGFFFLNIIPYTSDQSVVQRYLTVKDEKQALKSLWTNAWITMPGTVLFFGLGTVLYVFYKQNTGIIASDRIDEILPHFVVQQLPAGVSGLVIAGIFAASQSTLSGSMNSVSATFFSDIYIRFSKTTSEKSHLRVARIVTVITGLFGTLSAMAIVLLNAGFMFDLFQEVLGILGGGLAGVFILGIFVKRANSPGAIVGLFSSVLIVWLIKQNTSISVYLYGAISIISSVVVGLLVSAIVPGRKSIAGLTYYSLKQQS